MSERLPPPPRRIVAPSRVRHWQLRTPRTERSRLLVVLLFVVPLPTVVLLIRAQAVAPWLPLVVGPAFTLAYLGALVWAGRAPALGLRRVSRDRRALRHGRCEEVRVVGIDTDARDNRELIVSDERIERTFESRNDVSSLVSEGDAIDVLVGDDGHLVAPLAIEALVEPLGAAERTRRQAREDSESDSREAALFGPAGEGVPLLDRLTAEVEQIDSGELELEDQTLRWDTDGVTVRAVDGERHLKAGSIQLSRSRAARSSRRRARLHVELREGAGGQRFSVSSDVAAGADLTGIPSLREAGEEVDFRPLFALLRALVAHGWSIARFLPAATDDGAAGEGGGVAEQEDSPDAHDDDAPSRLEGQATWAPSWLIVRLGLAGRSAVTAGAVVAGSAVVAELGWLALAFGLVLLMAGVAMWRAAHELERQPLLGDVIRTPEPEPTVDEPIHSHRLISPGYGVGGGVGATWGGLVLYFGGDSAWPILAAFAVWLAAVATRRDWPHRAGRVPWWNGLPTVVAWLIPGIVATLTSGLEIFMPSFAGEDGEPVWKWVHIITYLAIFTMLPALWILRRGVFWRWLWKHQKFVVIVFPLLAVFGYMIVGIAWSIGIMPPLLLGMLAGVHPVAAGVGGALAGTLYGMVVAAASGMLAHDDVEVVREHGGRESPHAN